MPNRKKKILVVDDDTTFLLMLQSYLEKKGFETHLESTAEKGLASLKETDFDLILSDYRLPGMDGMQLLSLLNDKGITTPLILITSYGDIKLAVKAMKMGAADYLTKPVNPEELLGLVKSVFDETRTIKKDRTNKEEPQPTRSVNGEMDFVKGISPQTKQVNEFIELVAPTNISVLIEGESGTGKEYVAREIHRHSKRHDKPFVAIDCGALSKDLAASELFGHIKGTFTGATTDRAGQFEVATGGTLFLDEVGNLSYEVQVKLLRALQEKMIRRVGGRDDIPVDVRLIAATNENLLDAIDRGSFREDLYHRLNEFRIEISPLRVREKEVLQFAMHFLEQANNELEKNVEGFSPETLDLLKNYNWPGNLRELKNVVKRSVLLTKGDYVEKEALPGEVAAYDKETAANVERVKGSTNLKQLETVLEKQKIVEALEKVRYNKTKAAKLLHIDRKTLYNKIKTYGLKA